MLTPPSPPSSLRAPRRLQRLFVDHVYEMEAEEYAEEGIQMEDTKFGAASDEVRRRLASLIHPLSQSMSAQHRHHLTHSTHWAYPSSHPPPHPPLSTPPRTPTISTPQSTLLPPPPVFYR